MDPKESMARRINVAETDEGTGFQAGLHNTHPDSQVNFITEI
jgi:hypothetical protein